MPDDEKSKRRKLKPKEPQHDQGRSARIRINPALSPAFLQLTRQLEQQHEAIRAITSKIVVPQYPSILRAFASIAPASKSSLVDADADLLQQIAGLHKEISKYLEKDQATQREKMELATKVRELEEKQRLQHMLSRVGEAGQRQLYENPDFRAKFNAKAATNAYVLSIDLRRSTELMLKAREPRLYATFLLGLAEELRRTVMTNFGIFDKFTGDGVLAFFPEFFSGPDAGLWAARTAFDAHNIFERHYREHRRSFLAVLKDAGLGIGLDFGPLHIVEVGAELTVVGNPVVYACRMATATARTTFVNQPAYERLSEDHGEYCDFREAELEIKHEGPVLAYELRHSGTDIMPRSPAWATAERDDSTQPAGK